MYNVKDTDVQPNTENQIEIEFRVGEWYIMTDVGDGR